MKSSRMRMNELKQLSTFQRKWHPQIVTEILIAQYSDLNPFHIEINKNEMTNKHRSII